MIVVIHADQSARTFTLDPFALDPHLGLSVSCGDLKVFGWEDFRRDGMEVVKRALNDYYTTFKPGLSQFDRMPHYEKVAFLRNHVSLQVSRRAADLWWIDLMVPVGDGSIPSPMGPPHRLEFHPLGGADRFFNALLRLMSSANTRYNRN